MTKKSSNFSNFFILLIEPKYSGNVGAVARAMKNFDFENLILVNPGCELDNECYARSMHAQNIIQKTKTYQTFDEATQNIDYLIATSSIDTASEKKHLRKSVSIDDILDTIFLIDGNIGVVFGREDYGLYNEEIAACDILLRVPTSNQYPSMNLSHAVIIVLYSLYCGALDKKKKTRKLGKIEKEKLYEFFSNLLDSIDYPEHKKQNTKIMFRRIMGRAMPSKWEYHTLMGVFGEAVQKLRKKKG